jgi:hypothetical protein
MALPHPAEEGVVTGQVVQDCPLCGPVPQRLVVLLAADVHQGRPQFAQGLHGHRPAVDPGPGAPVGADHPAQQAAGALIGQLVVHQPAAAGAAGPG